MLYSVNIGQNNPGNANPATQSTASSQTSGTNPTQQPIPIPTATNIPGVQAGNLDFSNFARSLGSMVQGLTGRLIPGATLMSQNPVATPPSTTSNTTPPTQNSNTSTGTTANNTETDTVTEQMLGGRVIFRI